jgi:hypothetical protein
VATEIGLDKLTGVSINALTGCLVAVPYAFAIVAMIWWARHSDAIRERVWHVVLPAVVSGALAIGVMGGAVWVKTGFPIVACWSTYSNCRLMHCRKKAFI